MHTIENSHVLLQGPCAKTNPNVVSKIGTYLKERRFGVETELDPVGLHLLCRT